MLGRLDSFRPTLCYSGNQPQFLHRYAKDSVPFRDLNVLNFLFQKLLSVLKYVHSKTRLKIIFNSHADFLKRHMRCHLKESMPYRY